VRGSVRGPQEYDPNDTGSESMVSADFSVSEMSYATTNEREHETEVATNESTGDSANSEGGLTPRPLAMHFQGNTAAKEFSSKGDAVPPVPPLPPSLRASSVSPVPVSVQGAGGRPKTAPGKNTNGDKRESANGSVRSLRQSRSLRRGEGKPGSGSRDGAKSKDGRERVDFRGLLDAIGVEDDEDEDSRGSAGKPPY